jgi:Mn2+/Fe2+ NRAMP family transporter
MRPSALASGVQNYHCTTSDVSTRLSAGDTHGTIEVATPIGMFINFVGIDPIKALFWAAVLNGAVAVPLMVVIMIMAVQKQVMGAFTRAAAALGDGAGRPPR